MSLLAFVPPATLSRPASSQPPAFVLPSFAKQIAAIAAGKAAPVIEVGNLDAARDFLHIDDVVRAYAAGDRETLKPLLTPTVMASFESGIAGARRLLDLDDPPTAIFGANDDTACGVIYEAAARGLAVPDQLSVFGFDDTPMSRQVWPSLSTIRQPSRDMGRIAARQLLDEISGHGAGGIVRLPYQLQIRHSTGPVPAGR